MAQVAAPAPITRPASPPRPKTASTATKRPKTKASTVKWPAQASCPYCAQLLVPAPTTHKRCTRCKQRVIVRRVDDRVAFLTEAAVAVFEAERRRVAESRHWVGPRNHWIRLAEAADAPADRVAKVMDMLATPESTFAARSVYFAAVDRAVKTARAEHDWPLAVRLRRTQAVAVLKAAGSPRPLPDDVVELHRDAAAIELRGIQESPGRRSSSGRRVARRATLTRATSTASTPSSTKRDCRTRTARAACARADGGSAIATGRTSNACCEAALAPETGGRPLCVSGVGRTGPSSPWPAPGTRRSWRPWRPGRARCSRGCACRPRPSTSARCGRRDFPR